MKSVVYFENTVKIGKYLAGVIVNTNQDIFKQSCKNKYLVHVFIYFYIF